MWGLKEAPRAFSMRLSRSLRGIGYQQGVTDKQIWRKFDKSENAGDWYPLWIPSAVDQPHRHTH
eukprot:12759113-Prorocentrum_lima.AAC.1